VQYFALTHAHKPKFGPSFQFFFFADSSEFFSSTSFPGLFPFFKFGEREKVLRTRLFFSLLFFPFLFLSLSVLFIFFPLSPFYPLEKCWPQPFKKPGNGTLINYSNLAYFTPNFAPQTGFSRIALPEFGRCPKWTRVWMGLSLLC